MSAVYSFLSRLRSLFGSSSDVHQSERLEEELSTHIELLAKDLERNQGLSPTQARATARRELGNLTQVHETHRDQRGFPLLDTFVQDLRYCFRQLRTDAGFAATAILTLAVSIGASTAMFSVVDAVLLRPVPFEDAERLVRVANAESGGLTQVTSRALNLRDWRRYSESFEELGGYFAFFDYQSYNLVDEGEPERLVGVGITQNFLDMLGVEPALGRNFLKEEADEANFFAGQSPMLLTHEFWVRRYASDPTIVGRNIRLGNGNSNLVVGVLPESFSFTGSFAPASRVDFFSLFPINEQTDGAGNTLAVIGRLKPGATVQSAQAELDVINAQLHDDDPKRWGLNAYVTSLDDYLTGEFRPSLLVITGAVGLVLLIACTNLSNLLLSRAATRRREIAIRSALGASRFRLIRQLLVESLTLSGCGAILGVALAFGVTRIVAAAGAIGIPALYAVKVNMTALGFTLLLAVSCGLLFGFVPALQISQSDEQSMREASRGTTDSRARARLRGIFVVSEVAFACVLLIGAGLLMRSFVNLLDVDLGFQPGQAIAWRVDASQPEGPAYYDRLVNQLKSVPGVELVGLTDTLPLSRNRSWGVRAKDVIDPQQGEGAMPRMIDEGYLRAMRIPLLAGRNFRERDDAESEGVVIVNEALANALWPGEDPLDKFLVLGGRTEFRVVGVAQNVRHTSLEEAAGNEMYFSYRQISDWSSIDAVVRTNRPLSSITPEIRTALAQFDATLPNGEFQALGDIIDRAISPRRFFLLLVVAFAAIALLLAAIGIYGLISYSVQQRRQEISIRMALGASAANVRWRVLRHTVGLAVGGILIGLGAAFAVSRLMSSLLYGVEATDPVTFSLTVTVLLAIALLAGFVPARRAARADAMSALRPQ